jgi:hypothetical protein
MRRANVGTALLLVLLLGCSGPHKGDVYWLEQGGSFFTDEMLFRNAADRRAANVSADPESEVNLQVYLDGRRTYLHNGTEVKVMEPVSGGAKVVVATGEKKGQIGWMLAGELPEGARK